MHFFSSYSNSRALMLLIRKKCSHLSRKKRFFGTVYLDKSDPDKMHEEESIREEWRRGVRIATKTWNDDHDSVRSDTEKKDEI